MLWHHGSPQTGAPLEPLVVAAAARGIRLLSYARPSYGGSSPKPGRAVASAAAGVVCLAGIAPLTAEFDWWSGMADDGGLRAAVVGRAARAHHAASAEFDPSIFIPADWAALKGAWSSLDADAARANAVGPDGSIDDDIAFVAPWGFELAQIVAPVLLVQGGLDRVVPPAHADWLLRHCPRSELWLRSTDGHVSVLDACPAAMDWLSR